MNDMNNKFDDMQPEPALSAALRTMAEAERDRSVRPMAADRIMRSIKSEAVPAWSPADLWSGQLVAWFRPVVVTGLLLIALLAGYNLTQATDGRTAADRVLNLPAVTVATVYDMDMLLDEH